MCIFLITRPCHLLILNWFSKGCDQEQAINHDVYLYWAFELWRTQGPALWGQRQYLRAPVPPQVLQPGTREGPRKSLQLSPAAVHLPLGRTANLEMSGRSTVEEAVHTARQMRTYSPHDPFQSCAYPSALTLHLDRSPACQSPPHWHSSPLPRVSSAAACFAVARGFVSAGEVLLMFHVYGPIVPAFLCVCHHIY